MLLELATAAKLVLWPLLRFLFQVCKARQHTLHQPPAPPNLFCLSKFAEGFSLKGQMARWRLELLITFQLVEGETNLGGSLWRGYNETEFLKKILPNLPTSRLKKKKTKKQKQALTCRQKETFSKLMQDGKPCCSIFTTVTAYLYYLSIFTIYLYTFISEMATRYWSQWL